MASKRQAGEKLDNLFDNAREAAPKKSNTVLSGSSRASGETMKEEVQLASLALLPEQAEDSQVEEHGGGHAFGEFSLWESDSDSNDETDIHLDYNVYTSSKDEGLGAGDSQEKVNPLTPNLNKLVIPSQVESHNLNSMADALKILAANRFIVNHEYILFPYLIEVDGVHQRPTHTTVSHQIKQNQRYTELKQELACFDKLLNSDTSTSSQLDDFATRLVVTNDPTMSPLYKAFLYAIKKVCHNVIAGANIESDYRYTFASFLRIFTTTFEVVIYDEPTRGSKCEIDFPLKKAKMSISGKPDIIIASGLGPEYVYAVVECKKYHQMKLQLPEIPDPNGKEIEKIIPRVKFQDGILKKPEDIAKSDLVLQNMYKDLDRNVCRHLRKSEKSFFHKFIAQITGEMLAWFKTTDKSLLHDRIQATSTKPKVIRYGIGQVGFKIMFITMGINADYMGEIPFLEIGQAKGHGLDLFITKPLDLMKADERAIISDIIFAMLQYNINAIPSIR